MLLSIPKLLTLAVALASTVTAVPVENQELEKRSGKMIIGYNTVSGKEAKEYKKKGTLTFYPVKDVRYQLGEGVYLAPNKGDLKTKTKGVGGVRHCVIRADKNAMNRVSKAWVPEYHQRKFFLGIFKSKKKHLWGQGEKQIEGYIKNLEGSWDPKKTLRMSWVDYGNGKVHLAIPPGLLNGNGGGLGLTVECKKKKEDLPDEKVNYDNWHENIKGERG
ncbi:hypothetical protein AJ79_00633 [Helicocarpus griseus UAMH5409]|uniref:Enterotoxin n=1 Tax=Helicocarpus griseus UAMH5409 TaxID=1447875 RepID=A0A2B7Y2I7_9EURO|nr:hypothetical protein AJ79_00633 [Helicocarpus griseus UAMH5409]